MGNIEDKIRELLAADPQVNNADNKQPNPQPFVPTGPNIDKDTSGVKPQREENPVEGQEEVDPQRPPGRIGRAHVCTPVTV